jgi:hypothetical protein
MVHWPNEPPAPLAITMHRLRQNSVRRSI